MNNYYFLFTIVILFNYSLKVFASSSTYYDLEAIKRETGWSNVTVQEFETVNHLSLISQSPYYFNEKEIDPNYYYPSTAGEGIDIYVIDFGVDFNHDEFEIKDSSRTITCDAIVTNTEIHETSEEEKKSCVFQKGWHIEHGMMAASLVGGNKYGVAKKANIHFLASENSTDAHDKCADYIIKHAEPGKTVVSISTIDINYNPKDKALLEKLTKNGFIVIVSAGNDDRNCCSKEDGLNFFSYPGYRVAITTGAAEGRIYEDGYKMEYYSNYGDCVDIFVPVNAMIADHVMGRNAYKKSGGTSAATPIVAGMAALIMAEHPEITYNQESMRQALIDMSLKDAITDLNYVASHDTPNRFANNGKKSVYSPSDSNIECGISADGVNHGKCSDGCCSKEGKCIKFENNPWDVCLIENGCQSDYGLCYTKEETVSKCEEFLENHKECIGNPLEDANVCNEFNTEKCKNFYKQIYADESVCSFVKRDESNRNRSSLGFVFNFNKEKYNEYYNICSDDMKYHISCCRASFGQCNILDMEKKYNLSLEDILGKDERLKYNHCSEIYDDMNKLTEKINRNHSCVYIKEHESYRYLFDNAVQLKYYKHFVHDYLLGKYKIYESSNMNNVAEDEIKEKCEEYQEIYRNPFINRYDYKDSIQNKEDIELIEKSHIYIKNYFDKCAKKEVIDNEEYHYCMFAYNVVSEEYNVQWSIEHETWCIIDPIKKKCWSESLGYPCCKSTDNVEFIDEGGKWGIENNNWCGINN